MPVLSLRLRPNRLQRIVLPTSFQVAALEKNDVFFKIILNGTLSTDSEFDITEREENFVEFDTLATSITGGNEIDNGFINADSQGDAAMFDNRSLLQFPRKNMGQNSVKNDSNVWAVTGLNFANSNK